MIAIDLSKQQAIDADLKAMKQINFTEILKQNENITMFLSLKKQKKLF